jgi:VWFA-related protein
MSASNTVSVGAMAVLGLAAVLAAQTPATQTPQATFKSGVDLVDVDVSVLDEHRHPVKGLTAADFTVYEDGKPRPIAAFTPVDLPPREIPTAPWMDAIAPDVATNRFPSEGRLVVLLMDRFIATDQRPIARMIGEAAIGQLRHGDLAAVVFSTHGIPQNFTSDRQLLLDAVRRPFATLPDGDTGGAGSCYCGACSLETIANIAEGMREVRQRRKLLMIVGSNISISPMAGTCVGVLNGVRDRAIRAIKAGNITVYAFDPAGLDAPTPSAASSEPPNYAALRAAILRRRANIGVLPGETGGRVIGGNTPAGEVTTVFRESASYYVLGFQPASSAADGKYHDISVKVSRAHVILQARQGYFAPGGKLTSLKPPKGAPPVLATAVAGVWPRTDLALAMQVVPFALPGLKEAELRITIGARGDLRGDPPATTQAEVFVGAFDRNGKSLGDTKLTAQVPVRRASDGTPAFEYEIPLKLKVKPGRYEVRAAVSDQVAGASGSVYGYVEVPEYGATPVSLSGIMVQALPEMDAEPKEFVPFVPTARREFGRNERVTAVLRENQGLTQPVQPGYLNVQIVNERDERVFGHEARLLAEQYGANRAADHAVDLPLTRLDPGEYVLVMEVRHGNVEARRELRFRVR